MNKTPKILIIVEGEKKDYQLMKRAFNVLVSNDVEIVAYGTNIYDLYDRLRGNSDDKFQNLDLLLTLRERERDEEKRQILNDIYTDIILIFDFDPQDNRYDVDKLDILMRYFYDSTENGRLYLNYPMIEANLHFSFNDGVDLEFPNRKCYLEELIEGTYKTRVSQEGIHKRINYFNKEIFVKIIREQQKKLQSILHLPTYSAENVIQDNLIALKDRQVELLSQCFWCYVIGTCLFYVVEYYPKSLSVDSRYKDNVR